MDKRIERLEDKLLSRTQVVGIVITSMVAAICGVAALLAIFKALWTSALATGRIAVSVWSPNT